MEQQIMTRLGSGNDKVYDGTKSLAAPKMHCQRHRSLRFNPKEAGGESIYFQ